MGGAKIHGNNIIGIDETLNGFHLEREGGNGRHPMIICGYLIENFRRNQKTADPFGRKGAFSTRKMNLDEVIRRSDRIFAKHPDFYYSTIPSKDIIGKKLENRARPIAMEVSKIALSFILNYELDPDKTVIYFDQMTSRGTSEAVQKFIDWCVKDISGLSGVRTMFKHKADKNLLPVRRADTAGHYIGALKYRTGSTEWPYKERNLTKVDLADLVFRAKK